MFNPCKEFKSMNVRYLAFKIIIYFEYFVIIIIMYGFVILFCNFTYQSNTLLSNEM